jgi:hypothetical protein
MSDIQRWHASAADSFEYSDGYFVTYADHVEALRQAEQRGYLQGQEDSATQFQYGVEQGQRDAIAAAVQRVEALIDPWPNTSPGLIRRGNVFAAIKGEQP